MFGASGVETGMCLVARNVGATSALISQDEARHTCITGDHRTSVHRSTKNDLTRTLKVIVLSEAPHWAALVLEFPYKISTQLDAKLNDATPTLSAFWAARTVDLTACLHQETLAISPDILGPDNPFDLTRAEVRVCKLILAGMRPKEMAVELDKSITTVRTHLRNVYAKTELDGMFSVLHHLRAHASFRSEAA